MHRLRTNACLLALLLSLLHSLPAPAAGGGSGLPIPRFVSLRATEANMRAGPGEQYPIKWTYRRQGLPLEVTAEYEHWRRVRDWQGAEGWMHSSMLTGKRSIIVTGDVRPLHAEPDPGSGVLARIEGKVVGRLLGCPKGGDWCQVQVAGVKGWLRRNEMWGVYKEEEIE
jgi:SH3-like domain-containing protein